MRTVQLQETNTSAAWLESSPREGQKPLRAVLERLPFTIGRNEACDLTVESSRISREHLRIEQVSTGGFIIRDLESTNGTYVNGVRIQESPLNDGDLLSVANVGFIFHTPRNTSGSLATHAYTQPGLAAAPAQNGAEIIEEIRRLQEVSLHRACRHRVQAIVEVGTGDPIGYELSPFSAIAGSCNRGSKKPVHRSSRAAARANDIFRRTAVEQAWSVFGNVPLFFSIEDFEFGSVDLLDSLERFKQRPTGESQIALQLPDIALADRDAFCEFHEHLHEIGVLTTIDHTRAEPESLIPFADAPPDYIRLTPSVVEELSDSSRQRELVRQTVRAAHGMGIRVIANGVKNEQAWNACQEAGIVLAMGDFAAAPMVLDSQLAASIRR